MVIVVSGRSGILRCLGKWTYYLAVVSDGDIWQLHLTVVSGSGVILQ